MSPATAPRTSSRGVIEVPAQLTYYERTPTPATARIVSYSDRRRVVRGVTGGLTCWGLALLSVFVPLGHFFLVPLFLIAGPVVLLMRLGEGVSLRGASGACPACGHVQTFGETGRLRERHPVRCVACGRELELVVSPVPGPAPAASSSSSSCAS